MLLPEMTSATSAATTTAATIRPRLGLLNVKPPPDCRGRRGGRSEGLRTPRRLLAYWRE